MTAIASPTPLSAELEAPLLAVEAMAIALRPQG